MITKGKEKVNYVYCKDCEYLQDGIIRGESVHRQYVCLATPTEDRDWYGNGTVGDDPRKRNGNNNCKYYKLPPLWGK